MNGIGVGSNYWIPNGLETKCLRHLDEPANWTILKRERPDEDQILDWSPFRRIFLINFIQYAVILSVIYVVLAATSGGGISAVTEDWPIAVAILALMTTMFATYVTNLYRRTWNRRARSLRDG